MNVRAPGQWRWQLGGDNRFAIYAAGNPPEAFLTTRLKVDFWVEQEVRDLAWTSDRGYRSIMAFLRGLCMNKSGAKWWESAHSPMLWRYDDQGLQTEFDGFMMYRAVDVAGLLRKVSSPHSGEFSIAVDDPHLAENRGPWRVRFDADGTEVERTDKSDIRLGIGAFSQSGWRRAGAWRTPSSAPVPAALVLVAVSWRERGEDMAAILLQCTEQSGRGVVMIAHPA